MVVKMPLKTFLEIEDYSLAGNDSDQIRQISLKEGFESFVCIYLFSTVD